MELLETDDFKNQLLKKSEKHRQGIEGEVKLITENTEKMLVNALVIGGSLTLTYLLVRQFSGSSKKSKRKHRKVKYVHAETPEVVEVQQAVASSPGVVSQVGAALMSHASMFLLNLAKEKLTEYLQSASEKKSQE
jgi:hypothetical protein